MKVPRLKKTRIWGTADAKKSVISYMKQFMEMMRITFGIIGARAMEEKFGLTILSMTSGFLRVKNTEWKESPADSRCELGINVYGAGSIFGIDPSFDKNGSRTKYFLICTFSACISLNHVDSMCISMPPVYSVYRRNFERETRCITVKVLPFCWNSG
jgi:hypothetical protein